MKLVQALFAAFLVSCTPTKDAATTDFERDFRDYLDRDNFTLVAATIDDRVKVVGVDKVAPLVVDSIIAKWSNVEKEELENAARLGKDRALGKGKEDCGGCFMFRKTLDTLAPTSPELDKRWKALQPELEKAETAAYDTEKNDKRTIAYVWQNGSGGMNAPLELVSICFIDSLKKSFPQYKWLTASKAPQCDVIQFEVTGKTAMDKYIDSRTGKEATQLMSGLRVVITPRNMDVMLAPRFTAPLEAMSSVESPDTIRQDLPIGGPPTMETVRAGMKQIEVIQRVICTNLEKQIQQAAAFESPAPAASQKK